MTHGRQDRPGVVAGNPSLPASGSTPPTSPGARRYERKFVFLETDYPHLLRWLAGHSAGFRTAFPPRNINNLYFDTMELGTFEQTLSGESRRTKVRFRWYGEPSLPASGQLEVKRKRNQLGWKLSYPIEELPDTDGSLRALVSAIRARIPADARRWLDAFPRPVLVNRYRREYLLSVDGRIRATVDTRQAVYDQRYKPYFNLHRRANTQAVTILEIKLGEGDEEHAGKILRGFPVAWSRYSKYAAGVLAMTGL